MREETTAFLLTFAASSAFVAVPYILLMLKGIPISKTVPANRIVIELGIINTTFMLSRALGSYKSAFVSTKLGTSLVTLGIAIMLFPSFPTLVLGRALQGLGSGMVFPALEAKAAKRGVRGLVSLNVSQNLGFSFGSILAGAIMTFPREPLLIALPVTAISIAVVPAGKRSVRRAKSSKALKLLYLTAFVNGVALGARGPALSAYVLQYVSAKPLSFSLTWGVPGVAAMAISFLLARAFDELNVKHKLYASSIFKLLQSVATGALVLTRDLGVVVALLTASRLGSIMSVSISKAAQGEMSGRVEHFGARQTAFSLGTATGPLLGSLLYKALGPYSLVFVASLGLVSSGLYIMSGRSAEKG